MKYFSTYLFWALAFSIGFTGSVKSNQKITPKLLNQQAYKGQEKTGGMAFTCPAAKWSGLQSDFYYHFTLTHITTQDPKIVKLVRKAIKEYIAAKTPLNNGHHSVSWIQPGTRGVNSLFFTGEAAEFKLNLHKYLMKDPIISSYISPYIDAHVDVKGNFSKKLYNKFTVNQIIERKTL